MTANNTSTNAAAPAGYDAMTPAPPMPMAAPSKRGVSPWLQFLWMYLPFPVVGNVAWIAGTLFTFVSHRDAGPVAAENARQALNWCLTYNVVAIVLLGTGILVPGISTGWSGDGIPGGDPRLIPVFVFIAYLFIAGILVLVFGIVGAVRASRGEVMRTRIAIPFVRASRSQAPAPAMVDPGMTHASR